MGKMARGGKTKGQKRSAPEIQRERLIEEFASLDREIENYRPRIQRHAKLRELILEWNRDLPADQERTVAGQTCDILISARDNSRSVTDSGKAKLFKLWGVKGFIARAHVLIKSLPDPRDPEAEFTEQSLTGPRHLHVMHRAAAPAAAA